MDIKPIAFDSMGVRSMATVVETKDCSLFLDPGAALGPSRYGLPPTAQEEQELREVREEIEKAAIKAEVLTISHYHYDHYMPESKIYKDKIVYAKDTENNINKSQKERGNRFREHAKDLCELKVMDSDSFNKGKTKVEFSPPFPHGPEGIRLGFVIMTTVKEGNDALLHASDVQGPVSIEARDYITNQKPTVLIMDGPPAMFLGWKFSKKNLEAADENLSRIIHETDTEVVLDHHLLRSLDYKKYMPKTYATNKVKTAAEYLGQKNKMLEARRKELTKK